MEHSVFVVLFFSSFFFFPTFCIFRLYRSLFTHHSSQLSLAIRGFGLQLLLVNNIVSVFFCLSLSLSLPTESSINMHASSKQKLVHNNEDAEKGLVHVLSVFKTYNDMMQYRDMHIPGNIKCSAFFNTYFPEAHIFEPTKINGNPYSKSLHGEQTLSALTQLFPVYDSDTNAPLLTFTEIKIYLA